jgi:hypothetical protein
MKKPKVENSSQSSTSPTPKLEELGESLRLAVESIIANGKAETVEEALELIDQLGL